MLLTRHLALVAALALPAIAHAERETTRHAMERLEEILQMRQEDGLLDARDVLPTILVSATPRYESSEGWFRARALSLLTTVLGTGGVRLCEACMQPRTQAWEGHLEQSSGPVSLDEIIQLDDRYRGESARALTAIWIDETATGVAIRITDLRSARVVFAQNVDPDLREYRGSARSFRLSEEIERRTRGESLTHALFDLALYPGQHVSIEWADQWGETNANLSGVVFSFYDPVVGIGASYHRALEWQNLLLGGQVILSVPTVVAQAQTDTNADLIDPAFTGVAMARWPFGNSNYAALLSASTNGQIGIGISLLNTSLIPVLP